MHKKANKYLQYCIFHYIIIKNEINNTNNIIIKYNITNQLALIKCHEFFLDYLYPHRVRDVCV